MARLKLDGLTSGQWQHLAHLSQVSGMKRSKYVKAILTNVLLSQYATVRTPPAVPARKGKWGKTNPQLVMRVEKYLVDWTDAYAIPRGMESRTEVVRACVIWALRYSVVFQDGDLEYHHTCKECQQWANSMRSSPTLSSTITVR